MPPIVSSDSLKRLNAVRIIVVLIIALGYASTMPIGPGNPEVFAHLGYDPSWVGIQMIFFLSGFLALRSIRRHGSAGKYLRSRAIRNIPLLALFTLVTIVVIYPALNTANEAPLASIKKLSFYFFYTVSCVDPGRVLPGLLDEAKYVCLIQGAIWTFKWGLIAHIAAAIGTKFNMFGNNRLILAGATALVIIFSIVFYAEAKTELAILGTPTVALRLAYPFLTGMAVFAYQDRLPQTPRGKTILLAFFGGVAYLWYTFLPWTPVIEVGLTAFWTYGAFILATSKTPALGFLDNWPNLALGLYLVNWPISQLLLIAIPDITPWGLIGLCLPLSLITASAGHALVSRHSYTYAKKLSGRMRTLPAAA